MKLAAQIAVTSDYMQAPPNLTPVEEGDSAAGYVAASWQALLSAGINDWGGLSPLTRDFVNPDKPWPHLSALSDVTAAAGFPLLPRLDDVGPVDLNANKFDVHKTPCVTLRHVVLQAASVSSLHS